MVDTKMRDVAENENGQKDRNDVKTTSKVKKAAVNGTAYEGDVGVSNTGDADDEGLVKRDAKKGEGNSEEDDAAVENGSDDDEEEEEENEDEDEDGSRLMSKRAIKTAMKQRRWKIKKKLKKKAEKKKRHEVTMQKRAEWQEKFASMTEEEKAKIIEEKMKSRKERKDKEAERKQKVTQALTSGQNYVIDLEFCHLMTPQEVRSLIQQVMYSYAENCKADDPGRLTLTGVNGKIKEALDKISGFNNWVLHREEQSYLDVFKDRTEDLVYLTADSETVLEDIDNSKIYIIGGLVDRNRWKNITLDKAKKQGIATAKIPVGDHLKMTASQVLTVNQVMELMLSFQKSKDWKEALIQVVPLRKRAAECKLEKVGKGEKEADSD